LFPSLVLISLPTRALLLMLTRVSQNDKYEAVNMNANNLQRKPTLSLGLRNSLARNG
jgi:hypothetical protein